MIFELRNPISSPPMYEEQKLPICYDQGDNLIELESPPTLDPKRRVQRCLIANDEEMQLEILKYMFEKAGMEVTTAINGFQAFEMVSS